MLFKTVIMRKNHPDRQAQHKGLCTTPIPEKHFMVPTAVTI